MTIGTVSIIFGVVLLILLDVFSKDEDRSDQREGFHGIEQDGFVDIDASDDPSLAHLPGNSYHYSWLASNSDKD